MELIDYIIIAAIFLVVGGALSYIIWAKKHGRKCIGCPDAKTCASSGCKGNCSCCGSYCAKDSSKQ